MNEWIVKSILKEYSESATHIVYYEAIQNNENKLICLVCILKWSIIKVTWLRVMLKIRSTLNELVSNTS